MEKVRLILAVVSFAIGALIALRTLFGKPTFVPKYPALGFLYSVLFVIAGAWLFQRSSDTRITQQTSEIVAPQAREIFQDRDTDSVVTKSPPTSSGGAARAEQTTSLAQPESSDPSLVSEAPIRMANSAPWDRKLEISSQSLGRHHVDLSAAASKRPRKAEDIVEEAVIGAFDWIESFFVRYAAPTAESAPSQGAQSINLSKASIQFVEGTSSLQPESAEVVRAMAPALMTRFPKGSLVVRAAAREEDSNPALQNMLAQARAQAVCELLSSGGFPSDRLVAGVANEMPQTGSVELIHRP